MPRGNHAQMIDSNGGQRERQECATALTIRQHDEFWHELII